jgi:CheY-like chemotaxis protein
MSTPILCMPAEGPKSTRGFSVVAKAPGKHACTGQFRRCRQRGRALPLEVAFLRKIVVVIGAMKVLVAEDDQDSREMLSWMLQKLGHQVVPASNGREAWDAFRKRPFRLVISDVLMPEVDGFELCRRIRNYKQSRYTYIIIITALIGKKDYLEGMEAGADDFVTKPFDLDELKARLRVAERILSFQEQIASATQAALHKNA